MSAMLGTLPRADPGARPGEAPCTQLLDLIQNRWLTAVFQPIIDVHQGYVLGFEGLVRGPLGSPLHSPVELFSVARQCDEVVVLEYWCRRVVLESFVKLGLPGKLFLNISPDVLLHCDSATGETLHCVEELGLRPDQVIIEITENAPTQNYKMLRDATQRYRNLGFEIAIDDLGEGFSGLRLWSEIRPNYVKIDQHFIRSIHLDPVKLQFARSIQEMASKSGARVIAEGIETQAELMAVRNLGIAFGQGYHIARPEAVPLRELPTELVQSLLKTEEGRVGAARHSATLTTVEKLLRRQKSVEPTCRNEQVLRMFDENDDIYSIPVVSGGNPVGLLSRYTMFDRFARPYRRELYGRRPCESMMDRTPLIVERRVSLSDLSDLILQSEPHHLSVGFIITDGERYLGMGSGHDLLRLVTQMQINAARYANPLTLLPGNVPISEQIDGLLQAAASFVVCYCDLDHFKPFNDVYGYQKGDEVIQQTGYLLADACGPQDFLGHIGGDDFIVLFRSEDWETRCEDLLARVKDAFTGLYSASDLARGGIETEDRHGERRFHPLLTLSIGAVMVEPQGYRSHHEVSVAAATAKKQAKRAMGNSLFVERRRANLNQ